MTKDPTRLRHDDAFADELRSDLERAQQEDQGYDVVAGLARFEASIAALPGAGSVDPTAGTGTSASAGAGAGAGISKATLTIVAAIVGVVGVGVVSWQLSGGPEEPAVRVVATSAPIQADARAADATDVPPAAAFPPAVPPPVINPANPETTTADPVQRDPGAKRSPRKGGDPAGLAEEMRATQAAKKALATSPKRALELLGKANRKFSGGVFVEERRGLEVLALFEVRRTDAARRKAKAYLSRHPKGTYADRIRAKLGD